ncbi:DUF72 domain-containing protein [Phyllobacterium leguminum]|uniref:Uncharacterized protein YecE (DUF72 family) n=1 Tax=Phyllobacterium leguminum TaxID=314237 RepID=A0A318TEH9_9HYPH|nr:DUF72 domain-containing protein [Phyllobacterium leguminum]PYE86818.1 uncharacterized protein YecE (DUF72 family) [Phyllobacterium leguminum]
MANKGTIRAGIGGWTFAPWEGTFYPDDLPKRRQLEYASRQMPTIEVNGTYYGSQKPETFAKWASEVPDGFVFSLKGNRFITNRRVLAEAGESIERFLTQGITELGSHLGPILWQFAPTKKFDEVDFGAFLALLPEKQGGLRLRHTVEVRHPSFAVPEFVSLARKYGVAITYAEHFDYPEIADITADFVYARLQKGDDDIPTAYAPAALGGWAERAQLWAEGGAPDDLTYADAQHGVSQKPRDVFVYFIHEGKVRAPNAARAFMERIEAAG